VLLCCCAAVLLCCCAAVLEAARSSAVAETGAGAHAGRRASERVRGAWARARAARSGCLHESGRCVGSLAVRAPLFRVSGCRSRLAGAVGLCVAERWRVFVCVCVCGPWVRASSGGEAATRQRVACADGCGSVGAHACAHLRLCARPSLSVSPSACPSVCPSVCASVCPSLCPSGVSVSLRLHLRSVCCAFVQALPIVVRNGSPGS
jgi:hypothetical protein